MPASCSGAMQKIWQGASSIVTYYHRATDHESDAAVHLQQNEVLLCLADILSAIYDVKQMGVPFGGWDPYATQGPIWWYLTNCVSGYDLTMDDMISVMLAATEEEYRYFIGVIDAYRVGLWNKPFESEFYAALARGFAG